MCLYAAQVNPGDLDALAAPQPSVRGERPGATSGAATTGGRDEGPGGVRADIVGVVRELFDCGLITATGGNVSALDGERVWITPSQMFKGGLDAAQLVAVDRDGEPLDRDAASPSSERLMHTAVYAAKPQARAVIHCHAPHATILANSDLPFLAISTEAAFFAEIPRVPFLMPGTRELADAIGDAIGEGWAVLLKNHGLLVAGRSLRRAADMAEIVERTAEVILGGYAVGKPPPELPADVVDALRAMGDLVA